MVKTYRDWIEAQEYDSSFVEQPWFGVSQFCVGLQLADYVAYLINLKSQQVGQDSRKAEMLQAFNLLEPKIHLVTIS